MSISYEEKAKLLSEFLATKGYDKSPESLIGRWQRVSYTRYFNPSGVKLEPLDISYEKIGNLKYKFTVTDNGTAIVQSIYLYTSGAISTESCGNHWDLVQTVVFPINNNEEEIPYIDQSILDDMFENGKKGSKRYCTSYIETLSEDEHVKNYSKYEISLCGNYIVEHRSHTYYGPEDPDNNWQPIIQSGVSDPNVYLYDVYATMEKHHNYVSNLHYYRGGEDYKVGRQSIC